MTKLPRTDRPRPRVRASVMLSALRATKNLASECGQCAPLDPVSLNIDPYEWVSLFDYLTYLEEAARVLDVTHLGLELGSRFDVGDLGPLGVLFISSETIFDGFLQLQLFLQAWQEDTEVALDTDTDLYSWSYRIRTPSLRHLRRQDALLTLSVVTTWLRLRLGRGWSPAEVHFEQTAPADLLPFQRFFRAPLYFSRPTNGVFVTREEGNRRVGDRVQPYLPFMRRHLRDLIEVPVRDRDIAEAVKAEVARRLGLQPVTQRAIAQALGLSVRTLQRRLSGEGVGLRSIVDEVRMSVLHEALDDGARAGALARRLGYSDAASSCRAVRRWTGQPPSALIKSCEGGGVAE
ncbi:helix-turn-helix protein [Sphingobium sp. AEW010]|nr:helix-turn-helix protein [Sphingobium sp. AEW010]TWD18417.1 helix-turn-helix protein [Sphingobium sp. AEW013]TWD21045.1 helix-turn-helix protein [Sphingobium sp. AEW001]